MSHAPRIQDVASYKKLRDEMRAAAQLKRAMPILRPLLRVLGADVQALDEEFSKLDALVQQTEELTGLPDRFNDLFASRGWIMYPEMALDVAREAVALGEAGNLDGAEQRLVAYYTPETVRMLLQWMVGGVRAFRPRERLAVKALEDYAAERYHACVPVVLALLDGMVSELHEAQRGFFAGDVDLTAWDSIAAHDRGLNALIPLMQKGRRKVTTDPIPVPYRHGILHGMDLGYDTSLVAAKTWAALFATRDWAMKAERGQLAAPPPEKPPTWRELLARVQENEVVKQQLDAWRPRDVQVGRDVPAAGTPETYPEGTPERALVEFLTGWTRRNYGAMSSGAAMWATPPNKKPMRLREQYEHAQLRHFALEDVRDEAAAITVIDVALTCEQSGQEVTRQHTVRMIHEDERGDPVLAGTPGGRWRVVNWGMLPWGS